jgi:hypothetical protein
MLLPMQIDIPKKYNFYVVLLNMYDTRVHHILEYKFCGEG